MGLFLPRSQVELLGWQQNPPFIYKWTMFALEASERINMGSHRSHNVIFAVSFLIITSVQVPSFFFPSTCFFYREVCFSCVNACACMIVQMNTHTKLEDLSNWESWKNPQVDPLNNFYLIVRHQYFTEILFQFFSRTWDYPEMWFKCGQILSWKNTEL